MNYPADRHPPLCLDSGVRAWVRWLANAIQRAVVFAIERFRIARTCPQHVQTMAKAQRMPRTTKKRTTCL